LARPAAIGTLATMQQRCEVCENFRPEGDLKPGRKLEEVTYGARRVLLCRAHAGIAQNSGVTTFQELRELYREQHGARSYVPRRTRTTPVSTTKKSRNPGRRFGDSA
jgi:hypothetical protein